MMITVGAREPAPRATARAQTEEDQGKARGHARHGAASLVACDGNRCTLPELAADAPEVAAFKTAMLQKATAARGPARPPLRHCIRRLAEARKAATGPALRPAARRTPFRADNYSCAIVGSSDILRIHRAARGGDLGRSIDGHDVVIRINHAPTRGFEALVGSRTTYRFVNHRVVDDWLLAPGARLREFRRDVCDGPDRDVEVACLFKDRSASTVAALHRYQAAHGPRRMEPVGHVISGVEAACTRVVRPPLSGGFFALLATVQSRCALPVHVYGFYPFCCHSRPFPSLRYKYYHGTSTRWVCCAAGREDMEAEYEALFAMETEGLVRLHGLPRPDTPGPACSAPLRTPGTDSGPEGFARAGRGVLLRGDIPCPNVTLAGGEPCVCRVCAASAPSVCHGLGSACVGFEVPASNPSLATLKAVQLRGVATRDVAFYVKRAPLAAPIVRHVSDHDARAARDMACPQSVAAALPSASACVVCPYIAASACAAHEACTGFALNKEGTYATLKGGLPRPRKGVGGSGGEAIGPLDLSGGGRAAWFAVAAA